MNVSGRGVRRAVLRPWTIHSQVLAICGVIQMLIGYSLIVTDASSTRTVALQIALQWLPFSGWGTVWISVGVLVLVSSRWPTTSKTWGYVVMAILWSAWSTFYAAGIVFGDGPSQGWTQALIFALPALLWTRVAALVDPRDPADEGGA